MKPRNFLLTTSRQAVLVAFLMSAGCALAAGVKYSVLYRFQGGTDAAVPVSPLIADQAGNLYGSTQNGGGSGN